MLVDAADATGARTAAAISSVNWSRTSFAKNRESGAIVRGAGAAPLHAYAAEVFDADWAAGYAFAPSLDDYAFDAASRAVFDDSSPVNVTVPASPNAGSDACYDSTADAAARGAIALAAGASATIVANPDGAFGELTRRLNATSARLEVRTDAVHSAHLTVTGSC